MATKSGMNYDKVEKLIEYLDSQKTSIINNLTDLSNEAPSKIAAHYSGQAADTYKNTLTNVITKITETLDTMIAELKTNTQQKQDDYAAQDAKLQDSADVGISA